MVSENLYLRRKGSLGYKNAKLTIKLINAVAEGDQ